MSRYVGADLTIEEVISELISCGLGWWEHYHFGGEEQENAGLPSHEYTEGFRLQDEPHVWSSGFTFTLVNGQRFTVSVEEQK